MTTVHDGEHQDLPEQGPKDRQVDRLVEAVAIKVCCFNGTIPPAEWWTNEAVDQERWRGLAREVIALVQHEDYEF